MKMGPVFSFIFGFVYVIIMFMTTDNYIQDEILKKMSPEQKLQAAARMYNFAKKLKTAFLAQQHPDWTEEQVENEVRKIFANATT